METPATRTSAVDEALRGLVDYAGLFPPARLELREATDEYRSARAGTYAWMLGGFIVPLSLLATNADELREAPLCVILDGSGDAGAWHEQIGTAAADVARLRESGLRIQVLEVPLNSGLAGCDTVVTALRELRDALEKRRLGDLRTYVELPRDAQWQELLATALPEMAQLGLRAKVRCGGVVAAAFPSAEDVADFVAAACAAAVPFKATAGLHHPIRHRDASTGFHMHGFFNLLTAAALSPRVDRATLCAAIAEEDAMAFSLDALHLRWRSHKIDAGILAETRQDRFVSYGSCSFAEPVDDLIALGMLAP